MKILVTAGGTSAPIDRVRSITNAFTGKTGARIALEAFQRSHRVTLLTSHPETAMALSGGKLPSDSCWELKSYRTIDDLHDLMRDQVQAGSFDAVIHSAAVSDYRSGGIFAPAPGVKFETDRDGVSSAAAVKFIDRAAGKVKSDEPELWLRLVKAPKLIDFIRGEWNFAGLVVKFKLEVGVSDQELLKIAERSRIHSHADLMVANTLDQAAECAYLGPLDAGYVRIARSELPLRLIDALERLQRERGDG